MEDALRHSVSEVKSLRHDYSDLYEKFKQLAAHSSALQKQNESLARKNEHLKRRCREFESLRKAFEDDVSHLDMASKMLEKREQDVEESLSSLREQLVVLRGHSTLLEAENEDLKKTMTHEMIHVDAHHKQLERANSDFKVLFKRNEALLHSIESDYVRREEFETVVCALEEANKDREEKDRLLSLSQMKEAELRSSLERELQRLSLCEEEQRLTRQRLSEFDTFRSHHQDCETNLLSAYERADSIEASKAGLLTQLSQVKLCLRRERDATRPLTDQLNAAQRKVEELETEKALIINSKAEDSNRFKELQLKFSDIQDELVRGKHKITELLSQKTEAETVCEDLHGQRKQLDAEINKLREDNLILHRRLLETMPELESLRHQIEEFRSAVLLDSIEDTTAVAGRLNGLDLIESTYQSPSPSTSVYADSRSSALHRMSISPREQREQTNSHGTPSIFQDHVNRQSLKERDRDDVQAEESLVGSPIEIHKLSHGRSRGSLVSL